MSEVLLRTIIEKLEAREIASLKERNAGKDEAMQQTLLKEIKSFQSEITKLNSHLKISSEKMSELSTNISDLNFRLQKPIKEQIKHSHHLHKGIWIVVGLFIISLLFLYGWNNCNNRSKAFEANDMKYRYLKVNGNVGLLKLLYQTDSLYNINKDLFTKQVVQTEQHLAQQAELLLLASEKEKEAQELKQRAGKSLSPIK